MNFLSSCFKSQPNKALLFLTPGCLAALAIDMYLPSPIVLYALQYHPVILLGSTVDVNPSAINSALSFISKLVNLLLVTSSSSFFLLVTSCDFISVTAIFFYPIFNMPTLQ